MTEMPTLFVERLPEGCRRAVQLSVSGAKSRVQWARRMLAAMLRECCHLELEGRGGLIGYEPKRDPVRCRDCG